MVRFKRQDDVTITSGFVRLTPEWLILAGEEEETWIPRENILYFKVKAPSP